MKSINIPAIFVCIIVAGICTVFIGVGCMDMRKHKEYIEAFRKDNYIETFVEECTATENKVLVCQNVKAFCLSYDNKSCIEFSQSIPCRYADEKAEYIACGYSVKYVNNKNK